MKNKKEIKQVIAFKLKPRTIRALKLIAKSNGINTTKLVERIIEIPLQLLIEDYNSRITEDYENNKL